MATVKKGLRTATPEWRKHLREMKRLFWKGERRAVRKEMRKDETQSGER